MTRIGYGDYNNSYYNNINSIQAKPYGADKSVLGPQYDNIFASNNNSSNPIGDSFQSSATKNDNTPIGEEELSESDEQLIQKVMEQADVPESLESVAREHLAAMNKSGNSNSSTTNTANSTTSNDDKVTKLTEFLQNYYEQFGEEGADVSKGEYLKNVSQMAKADMESQGKPFVDPSSGFFDAKNYTNAAEVGRAFKNVQDANGGDTDSTSGSGSADGNNYSDYINDNQDNPKYAGLSATEKQRQLYSDYKYDNIRTRF